MASLSAGPLAGGWRYVLGPWLSGVRSAVLSGVASCGPLGGYSATWWGVCWATADESEALIVGSRGGALGWARVDPSGGLVVPHIPGTPFADESGAVRYLGEGIAGSGLDLLALRLRAGRLQLGDATGSVWVDEDVSPYLRDLPPFTKTALMVATNDNAGAAVVGRLFL